MAEKPEFCLPFPLKTTYFPHPLYLEDQMQSKDIRVCRECKTQTARGCVCHNRQNHSHQVDYRRPAVHVGLSNEQSVTTITRSIQ